MTNLEIGKETEPIAYAPQGKRIKIADDLGATPN